MSAGTKSNRGGKRTPGPGKKLGRPPKPTIELKADKQIATTVLAMDGAPDHTRECDCHVCRGADRKLCLCVTHEGETLKCDFCKKREEHKVCHCEVCGWWEQLLSSDKRIRYAARCYLTDRRDGKPAQGVFVGDTRETTRELDFGDWPNFVTVTPDTAAGRSARSCPGARPN